MFTENKRSIAFFIIIQITLISFTNLYGMKPYKKYLKTPNEYNIVYDSLNIVTSDNYRLNGWMLKQPTEGKKATIIISYGDAGNMSYYLDYGNVFYSQGYNVLLYDYRGFGDSQFFDIDRNMIIYPEFLIDLNAAIDLVIERYKTDIILFGHSLGATVSIAVAGQRNDIVAVVAEGPGMDITTTVELINALEKRNSENPRVYKIHPDYPDAAQPINAVKRFTETAFYVFTGSNDEISTPGCVFQLYDRCPSKIKSLWIAPDSDHSNIIFNFTNQCFSNIYIFLDKVFGNIKSEPDPR